MPRCSEHTASGLRSSTAATHLVRQEIVPQDNTFSIVRWPEKCQFSAELIWEGEAPAEPCWCDIGSAGASPSRTTASGRRILSPWVAAAAWAAGTRWPGGRRIAGRGVAPRGGHHGQQLAEPRAPAGRTHRPLRPLHQQFRLRLAFLTDIFVKRHGVQTPLVSARRPARALRHQRSSGRRKISLSTIACRTPPGLASIAAICAAGEIATTAAGWSLALRLPRLPNS